MVQLPQEPRSLTFFLFIFIYKVEYKIVQLVQVFQSINKIIETKTQEKL